MILSFVVRDVLGMVRGGRPERNFYRVTVKKDKNKKKSNVSRVEMNGEGDSLCVFVQPDCCRWKSPLSHCAKSRLINDENAHGVDHHQGCSRRFSSLYSIQLDFLRVACQMNSFFIPIFCRTWRVMRFTAHCVAAVQRRKKKSEHIL